MQKSEKHFMKELAKLERTHPQSPDYSVQLNYLQTMLNLPWGTYTTDNLNLEKCRKDVEQRPLRTGKSKRTYFGTPCRIKAER